MGIHKLNYNEISEALGYLTEKEQLRLLNELEQRIYKREPISLKDELTVNQYERLQASRQRVKEGKTVSHEEAMERVKTWIKR